jgi:hypothetical protein
MHRNVRPRHAVVIYGLLGFAVSAAAAADWQPVPGRIMTRWAKDVRPEKAWPDYPRPTMVRPQWQNLNGLWDYAIRPKAEDRPKEFDGTILVPFAVESALSGVQKPVGGANRLWYRRTFDVPVGWRGRRLLLHFGAVDWEATVWVNGRQVGTHRGGYDPFHFDITGALKAAGPQEIAVAVWDPTDEGTQPRGKQVRKPGGIWYTAVTGIWQTAWLEPVPEASIAGLKTVPDIETGSLRLSVEVRGAGQADVVRAVATDGQAEAARAEAPAGQPLALALKNPKLWTPDEPFLYGLRVSLVRNGKAVDEVESYFGMRSIALGKDESGLTRMMLNGRFLFQLGPLDQGWWPDGLYTAPTDEALRYDLEVLKRLGMNMLRKHVKVEPERLYYWCDRLGLLVWQDMPSGDRYIGGRDPDLQRTPESAAQFELELKRVIEAFGNHPSIVMWVPFNEGWGQYDTARIVDLIKKQDPTRLVDNASGWTDRKVGDVNDVHSYPGPGMPRPEADRAAVLGEFGGLGLPIRGHLWQEDKNWGYRSFKSPQDLTIGYLGLIEKMQPLVAAGLSAAVYTQTSDVEIEVNGLMTYDRAIVKMDQRLLAAANRRLYLPPPVIKTIIPTSQLDPQTWRYTTEPPKADWQKADLDDSAWKSGPGGFGTQGTPGAVVGTEWKTADIWMRRTFDISDAKLVAPHLRIHHDEDAEIYINGRLAARFSGYTTDYVVEPLDARAVALLKTGRNTLAVHCRQTIGGQYIDVGLVDVVRREAAPPPPPPEKPTTWLRPPAVPLVVHDPYFSVWSCDDHLYDSWPKHWTGATHGMCGMIRVDGKVYRFMGPSLSEKEDRPPAARQVGLEVLPTRTIYQFQAGEVELKLTFLTPMLPDDLEVLSRPLTYVRFDVRSRDGKQHEVAICFDATAEWAVDKPEQQVTWDRMAVEGKPPLVAMRVGSKDQPVLEKSGDNLRIDWGHFFVAAPAEKGLATAIAEAKTTREAFVGGRPLPKQDDSRKPRAVNDGWPVMACTFDLGRVSGSESASRMLMLAYDDEYSIQYLGTNLRPWWRRNGDDATALLRKGLDEFSNLMGDMCVFDHGLMADLEKVGGPGYAQLCAIAYRQAIGGHKLVAGPDGQPMLFGKECFSNGCIATVDVIYPAAPIFAALSNDLLKASVRPVLDYAATERWRFPFAPHDLGTYPKANGQVYGGGEKTEENQMPVEESGNMLILMAAIAQNDGNAEFAKPYWPQLEKWAAYLKQKGLDPENQLCTDDFAGHLAHNVNLSAKAIVALGAYATLADMAGKKDQAAAYRRTAQGFAKQWVAMADDGDHFRLTFDRPGTWSQKYNLVWDRLLGLGLFPPEVARKEIQFYKTKLNLFGLPLDNRSLYTKTDWEVWTATLAESRAEFETLMEPVYSFVSFTPQRVPLTDWYWTQNAGKVGFQARPVIGGVFIRMLADPEIRKKWSSRGEARAPRG